VSTDRIVDDLWSGEPPPKALTSLQVHVSHLRRALEPGRRRREPATVLVSAAPGYRLQLPRDAVDAWRFEDLVQRARTTEDPARRSALLEQALGCWSGPAYAEFAARPPCRPPCQPPCRPPPRHAGARAGPRRRRRAVRRRQRDAPAAARRRGAGGTDLAGRPPRLRRGLGAHGRRPRRADPAHGAVPTATVGLGVLWLGLVLMPIGSITEGYVSPAMGHAYSDLETSLLWFSTLAGTSTLLGPLLVAIGR
jgi:hypothetical protein